MVAAASEQLGFQPNVHFDGPVDSVVSDEVKAHLLAVVREAISNMSRHAKASRADVDLIVGDQAVLVVSDNGVGMHDLDHESGLANMRNRAVTLNGVMVVGASPEGGTRLEWRVPVGP